MEEKEPVFFGYTKSFWGGIFPTILTVIDILLPFLTADTVGPISEFIVWIISFTGIMLSPFFVGTVLLMMLPVYTIWVTYQRSGASRPYSLDPKAK